VGAVWSCTTSRLSLGVLQTPLWAGGPLREDSRECPRGGGPSMGNAPPYERQRLPGPEGDGGKGGGTLPEWDTATLPRLPRMRGGAAAPAGCKPLRAPRCHGSQRKKNERAGSAAMGWIGGGDVSCNVARGGWIDACDDVGWDVSSDGEHDESTMPAIALAATGARCELRCASYRRSFSGATRRRKGRMRADRRASMAPICMLHPRD